MTDQMALAAPDMNAISANGAREVTKAIEGALHRRFPVPEWLCVHQVGVSGRSLDAVVVRMWGRSEIHAFEIKATRSDWLRELRQPEKADVAVGYVDHFWLAAAKGVARPDEVPEHWGLLVLQPNGTLRAQKAATALAVDLRQRDFWTSLVFRAYQASDAQANIAARLKAEYERGEKRGREMAQWDRQLQASRAEKDAEALERIRDGLGDTSVWALASRIGAVREFIAGERATWDVREAERAVERALAELRGALADASEIADQ